MYNKFKSALLLGAIVTNLCVYETYGADGRKGDSSPVVRFFVKFEDENLYFYSSGYRTTYDEVIRLAQDINKYSVPDCPKRTFFRNYRPGRTKLNMCDFIFGYRTKEEQELRSYIDKHMNRKAYRCKSCTLTKEDREIIINERIYEAGPYSDFELDKHFREMKEWGNFCQKLISALQGKEIKENDKKYLSQMFSQNSDNNALNRWYSMTTFPLSSSIELEALAIIRADKGQELSEEEKYDLGLCTSLYSDMIDDISSRIFAIQFFEDWQKQEENSQSGELIKKTYDQAKSCVKDVLIKYSNELSLENELVHGACVKENRLIERLCQTLNEIIELLQSFEQCNVIPQDLNEFCQLYQDSDTSEYCEKFSRFLKEPLNLSSLLDILDKLPQEERPTAKSIEQLKRYKEYSIFDLRRICVGAKEATTVLAHEAGHNLFNALQFNMQPKEYQQPAIVWILSKDFEDNINSSCGELGSIYCERLCAHYIKNKYKNIEYLGLVNSMRFWDIVVSLFPLYPIAKDISRPSNLFTSSDNLTNDLSEILSDKYVIGTYHAEQTRQRVETGEMSPFEGLQYLASLKPAPLTCEQLKELLTWLSSWSQYCIK